MVLGKKPYGFGIPFAGKLTMPKKPLVDILKGCYDQYNFWVAQLLVSHKVTYISYIHLIRQSVYLPLNVRSHIIDVCYECTMHLDISI